MISIQEAIIVEGKYDKIKLSSLVDTLIIETNGFQIFRDKEQLGLIRKLANTRGVIVLTDSDAAGFVIRNYLTGSIDKDKIKQAYVPDVFGKEKRKEKASKEGKLGVEGLESRLILDALTRAGATFLGEPVSSGGSSIAGRAITKADFFAWGLSGGEDSVARRKQLLAHLQLPERMAPNAMLKVLNSMYSFEQFEILLGTLFSQNPAKS